MRAEEWVCSESVPGAFPLVTEKEVAALCYDDGEYAGVVRAIGDLQKDICRVTGRSPRVTMDDGAQLPVIIGTVGRSKRVTELLDSGLLHAEDLEGKRVIIFANLKEARLLGFPSHGMVLCACSEDHSHIEVFD